MKSITVGLVALILLAGRIMAFVSPALIRKNKGINTFWPTPPSSSNHRRHQVLLLFSSREEEIAKLEEQLRKLKEGQPETVHQEDAGDVNGKLPAAPSAAAAAPAVGVVVDPRSLEKVQGKDMILSEQALLEGNILDGDDESTSGGGGGVVQTVLTAVAAIAVLGVFSQIPIGQDELSKYSASPSAASASRTIDLGDLNTEAPRP